MVPAVPAELSSENPLAVCVEEFCQLPVDKEAFKAGIPEMVNLQPFSPFEFFIERKLFMHNMSHALTAYLGALTGKEAIWEECIWKNLRN
jgi:mannitol-1-phosphate 5-dehydrogenase